MTTEFDATKTLEKLLKVDAQAEANFKQYVPHPELMHLLNSALKLFEEQPMLLELEAPINIVGDVHGQYTDVLRLFALAGTPSADNPYLFLGDYVDRGDQGLETVCLLMALKVVLPCNFFLLRGNHEDRAINRIYGFYDECKRRYQPHGLAAWKKINDVFNQLPVAAIVGERMFCVHGGLSPEVTELEQLLEIPRIDVPDTGMLCDFLWSDPDAELTGWAENARGVSYTFGQDVVEQFLDTFDFDLVVRAHQVVEDGYEFFSGRQLVTLFSAPNYCGEFDNNAAIMTVSEGLVCSFKILKPA